MVRRFGDTLMYILDINESLEEKKEFDSYHVHSEKFMRTEIKKFKKGDKFGGGSIGNMNLMLLMHNGKIEITILDQK